MKKLLFIPIFLFLVCPAFAQWNGSGGNYPGVTSDGAGGLIVLGAVARALWTVAPVLDPKGQPCPIGNDALNGP